MSSESVKKCIHIDKDSIFRIKVECKDEFKNSFFKDVYSKANKDLVEIVSINHELVKNYESNSSNVKQILNNTLNNIICFTGERGTGKTSVMTSFVNSLQHKNWINDKQYKLKTLDIIDPSIFDDSDSIIEVIIAEMFNNIKTFDFCQNSNDNFSKRYSLIKRFQDVYKDLRTIKGDKKSIYREKEDDLEVLQDLALGTCLKKDLFELIYEYLKVIKEDFLIIPLDDLDMNIKSSDQMLEDIRKYLILPNVIIVMACKIEQLTMSIRKSSIGNLQQLIKYEKENSISKSNNIFFSDKDSNIDVQHMADKYLEKIIPESRRIFLPSLKNQDVNIYFNNNKEQVKNIKVLLSKKLYEYLRLIIIIDNSNDVLIPDNLRGTVNLLKMLDEMEYIDNNDRKIDYNKLKNNIERFKEYIINNICMNNFSVERSNFIKYVFDIKLNQLNKYVFTYLNNELYKLMNLQNLKEYKNDILCSYIAEINERFNHINEDNVSLGNVATNMRIFEEVILNRSDILFINVLKIVYSLRILDIYYSEDKENKNILLQNLIAGDLFGDYFTLSEVQYNELLKHPIKFEQSCLKMYSEKLKKDLIYDISKENYEQQISDQDKNEVEKEREQLVYGFNLCINPRYEGSSNNNKKSSISLKYLFYKDKYYDYNINYSSPKMIGSYKKFYFEPLNIIQRYIFDNQCDLETRDLICQSIFNQDLFIRIMKFMKYRIQNIRLPKQKEENYQESEQKDNEKKTKLFMYLNYLFKAFGVSLATQFEKFTEIYDFKENDFMLSKLIVPHKETNNKVQMYKIKTDLYEDNLKVFNLIKNNVEIDTDIDKNIQNILNEILGISAYLNDKFDNTTPSAVSQMCKKSLDKIYILLPTYLLKEYRLELENLRLELGRSEAKTNERKKAIINLLKKLNKLKEDLLH